MSFQSPLPLRLPASLPQGEHTLLNVEHGWHEEFFQFVQDGLPKILVALLITFVLGRVVAFFVHRMRRRADHMVGNAHRAAQLRTLAGIVRATSYALLGFYLVMQVLAAMHAPVVPFVASAGVIGLGISFGAQSLFKDMLTGVFILIEDQYSVGEVVKIAGLQGTVEHFTLRITQLRDPDGTLYIVPNSQIATVSNLSRDFSVATLTVSTSVSVDPDRVMAVLTRLTVDLRTDEALQDVIIADPKVLGVDKISGHEVLYPINLRVRANQRDGVLRELRRRVLIAFEKERIPFGYAGATVLVQSDSMAPPSA